ncbi:tyrosine-type recombinase/integrase [Nocardia sp. NPDC059154]|uniref:tyrosine-type recombinase/integrase n=1 Tax=Nocardia sp. NPDC059154 TaxID=3346744 RepID=UPI0036A96131
MLDDELRVVGCVDEFLRHLRFGQDCAEGTTAAYASSLVLYLNWCQTTSREWREAGAALGAFILWLRYTPDSKSATVLIGPGREPVRGERRVNAILTAVRGLLAFAVTAGEARPEVMAQIYELGSTLDLPTELRGEGMAVLPRAKARHRLSEPDTTVDRASDEEAVALLRACRLARDRFILLLLGRAGLRRSEAAGLRREDLHFVVDSTVLGCPVQGPHLHVARRANSNQAWAKSRHARCIPADWLVVQAYDQWCWERKNRALPVDSDYVLVNIARGRLGEPMTPGALNELLDRLAGRAGIERAVSPHMLRHAFASNVLDAGGAIDEVQQLLGHRSPSSTQVYIHPDFGRQRAAVERVAALREPVGGAR